MKIKILLFFVFRRLNICFVKVGDSKVVSESEVSLFICYHCLPTPGLNSHVQLVTC